MLAYSARVTARIGESSDKGGNAMRKKTNTWPVIMYPEGVIVGKVASGKNPGGKVRHVAKDGDGNRLGTFDTFNQAERAVIEKARGNSRLKASDIPEDFPVRPLQSADAANAATCGTCGLSWDDSISTSYTPAPSARCPFEYFHRS